MTPLMPDDAPNDPYHLQGIVNDYDVGGAGTCLTTTLIAYAEELAQLRAAVERKDASLSAALAYVTGYPGNNRESLIAALRAARGEGGGSGG